MKQTTVEGEGMQHKCETNKNLLQKIISLDRCKQIAYAFFLENRAFKESVFAAFMGGFTSIFATTNFWNTLFLQANAGKPSHLALLKGAIIASTAVLNRLPARRRGVTEFSGLPLTVPSG